MTVRKLNEREVEAAEAATRVLDALIYLHHRGCACGLCKGWWALNEVVNGAPDMTPGAYTVHTTEE